MSQPKDSVSLSELIELTGESERTLRYYIQLGLLSGPEDKGTAARYPASHVDKVARIRLRQSQGVPLKQIVLELQVSEGASPAPKPEPAPAARSSGVDYLLRAGLLPSGTTGRTAASPGRKPSLEWDPQRSRWERHVLEDGIELSIRRPLDTWTQRKVERLLKAAAAIFAPGGTESDGT